jgi:hypothetical protein
MKNNDTLICWINAYGFLDDTDERDEGHQRHGW